MPLSLKDAARKVLTSAGEPLHYEEITRRVLEGGLSRSASQTPAASLNAVLAVEIKRKGPSSPFVRVAPGIFGLRDPSDVGRAEETKDLGEDRRVRIPLFPLYHQVRLLLPVWDGMSRAQFTGLKSTIVTLRGTPQEPVDWSSPDDWIPERLTGTDRETAEAIWIGTGKRVNPRHVTGHWLLARNYGLLEESENGILRLSEAGKDFVQNPLGDTESEIDEGEGVLKLLALVADNGPASSGELVQDWGDYLSRRSKFGTDGTIKDTLRRRLRNLFDRKLIDRAGTQYTISDSGLAYMRGAGEDEASTATKVQEIRELSRQQETSVRESIRDILADLDPIGFEHLVKRLLEEMSYENVEVTSPSGDGGVDVVATIELGITSVREVVQAKRHRRTIQRKDLDALRGCLHRFGAVRGTIISTARYSRGTREAAFEPGAAPITLIDGEKLIDLLIAHSIGVRKKSFDVLELDPTAFAELDPNPGDADAEED